MVFVLFKRSARTGEKKAVVVWHDNHKQDPDFEKVEGKELHSLRPRKVRKGWEERK
jgi:hypothetical protein